MKKHSKMHKLLAETLLEFETLTGDEVRDIVLRGKKPDRPIINKKGGGMNVDSSLTGKKTDKGGWGLAGKVGSRREAQ